MKLASMRDKCDVQLQSAQVRDSYRFAATVQLGESTLRTSEVGEHGSNDDSTHGMLSVEFAKCDGRCRETEAL